MLAPFPGYSRKSQTFYQKDPTSPGPLLRKIKDLLRHNVTENVNPTARNAHPNTTSNVFRQKFRKEMIYLFSYLPRKQQCNILRKISRKVSCNISATANIISNITDLWSGARCHERLERPKCKVDDRLKLKIHKYFNGQLGKVFLALPLPFKCLILHSSALHSNYERLQEKYEVNSTFTLTLAEQEIEKLFKTVKLGSKCSQIPVNKGISAVRAALVNLTVQSLNKTKAQWIKQFKKESAQIFFEYMEQKVKSHTSSSNRRVPIFPVEKRRGSLTQFKKGNIRTAVRKVSNGTNSTFTLLFGFKVRSPSGEYKDWTNGKDIARSLRSLQRQKKLDKRLKARILKIRNLKRKPSKVEESLNVKLLRKEIEDAKKLFPKHLINYYRNIKKRNKCYVMYILAETLNKTLNTVEQLYSTLERVSQKSFCLRVTKGVIITDMITMIIKTNPPPKTQPLLPFVKALLPIPTQRASEGEGAGTEKPSTPKNSFEQERTKTTKTKKEITALEIALFAMLAFLCVAIVAFTINCIVFAIRTRSYAKNRANGTSPTNKTVFSKVCRVSKDKKNSEEPRNSVSSWNAKGLKKSSKDTLSCCLRNPKNSTTSPNQQQTSDTVLQGAENLSQLQVTPQRVTHCKQEQTSPTRTVPSNLVIAKIEQPQVNHEIQCSTHFQSSCTTV